MLAEVQHYLLGTKNFLIFQAKQSQAEQCPSHNPNSGLLAPQENMDLLLKATTSLNRAKTPNLPRRPSNVTSSGYGYGASLTRSQSARKPTTASSPGHSLNMGRPTASPSTYSFQPVVKPSVVRPYQGGVGGPSSNYRSI